VQVSGVVLDAVLRRTRQAVALKVILDINENPTAAKVRHQFLIEEGPERI
jgi:hypothetical protein